MEYHTEKLGRSQPRADLCLLCTQDTDDLTGIVIMQIDDSLITGLQTFVTDENTASKAFLSKPRQPVGKDIPAFNGLEVSVKKHKNSS